jgi:hypothetical protein
MFIFRNQQILKFFEPNEKKPNKCDFPSSSKFRLWAAIVSIRPGTKKASVRHSPNGILTDLYSVVILFGCWPLHQLI